LTKNFERILVPYNGTSGSNKAFRKAVSLASAIGAEIMIITCLEEKPTLGFFKTKTNKQEFEKQKNMWKNGMPNWRNFPKDIIFQLIPKLSKMEWHPYEYWNLQNSTMLIL